jgi:hypothetical protein
LASVRQRDFLQFELGWQRSSGWRSRRSGLPRILLNEARTQMHIDLDEQSVANAAERYTEMFTSPWSAPTDPCELP